MITIKQIAFDFFEENRSIFLQTCRDTASSLADKHGQVTIDDVRALCPLPEGMGGRVYGAVFKSKDRRKDGYTQTTTPTSH